MIRWIRHDIGCFKSSDYHSRMLILRFCCWDYFYFPIDWDLWFCFTCMNSLYFMTKFCKYCYIKRLPPWLLYNLIQVTPFMFIIRQIEIGGYLEFDNLKCVSVLDCLCHRDDINPFGSFHVFFDFYCFNIPSCDSSHGYFYLGLTQLLYSARRQSTYYFSFFVY